MILHKYDEYAIGFFKGSIRKAYMVIAAGFPNNENVLAEMQKKTLSCSEKTWM